MHCILFVQYALPFSTTRIDACEAFDLSLSDINTTYVPLSKDEAFVEYDFPEFVNSEIC